LPPLTFEQSWTPCPPPWDSLEVYRLRQSEYVLGIRGALPDRLRRQLLELEPASPVWKQAILNGARRSRAFGPGRFLGRYVRTMTQVFPFVAVFSTAHQVQPSDDRDTFVIVCARQPLDFSGLDETGYWTGRPFAVYQQQAPGAEPQLAGQMEALLELADGLSLTDDFAPVDTLLRPVFTKQD
jgi:hypothetical protein